MKNFSRVFIVSFIVILALFSACKKEAGPNDLGGDVNLDLTAVDSVTTVYITVNGFDLPVSGEITIRSNDNGMVTYGGTYDLSIVPDTIINIVDEIVTELINYYHPSNLVWDVNSSKIADFQFTVKITSEGMQNYFVDGKPWTFKYADPQGTVYEVKRDNGDVLKATVTEKTGENDFPYGFYYIKTSKLEYDAPADDPHLQKVTFRLNHKFGVVYLKADTKDGNSFELGLFPFYVL